MINFIKPVYADTVDLTQHFAFGNITSLSQAFNYLIPVGFAIASAAVVIYFIIGALRYILSGGDKDKVLAAQNMIVHSLIGFLLLSLMFIIVQILPRLLGINDLVIVGR